jgi:hypothetical protein
MMIEGTVVHGVVVADPPAVLPEGVRVRIVLEEAPAKAPATNSLRELLLENSGCMTDLPADLAEQHDHYLHGTPNDPPRIRDGRSALSA